MRRLGALRVAVLFACVSLVVPATVAVAGAPGAEPTLATVEAVVTSSAPADTALAGVSARALLGMFVRCIGMPGGGEYCLHLGWPATGAMDAASLADVLDRAAAADAVDRSLIDEILVLSRKPAAQRLAIELVEIREAFAAAQSVAHDRDAAATIGATSSTESVIVPDYPIPPCDGPCPPSAKSIMDWSTHGREQIKSYYCGAATTQMAALWRGVSHSQDWWWPYVKLAGSNEASLSHIKAALNSQAGYQSADPFYIMTFSSSGESLYLSTIVNKIWHDANPLISHVQLEKQYFAYLLRDHGGHYQVIRGYDRYDDPDLDPRVKIFEPYNEDTWWHNGNDSAGARAVVIGKMFAATLANYGQLGA